MSPEGSQFELHVFNEQGEELSLDPDRTRPAYDSCFNFFMAMAMLEGCPVTGWMHWHEEPSEEQRVHRAELHHQQASRVRKGRVTDVTIHVLEVLYAGERGGPRVRGSLADAT